MEIREIDANVVPVNILNPIPGTPLENQEPLPPMEILKTIAVFRFILPQKEIMIAGGRTVNLRDMQSMVFTAGASALMVGNYLTTLNQPVEKDLQMLRDLGLDPTGITTSLINSAAEAAAVNAAVKKNGRSRRHRLTNLHHDPAARQKRRRLLRGDHSHQRRAGTHPCSGGATWLERELFPGAGELPLYGMRRLAKRERLSVYISTGIHGDEPGGPVALAEMLEANAWPSDVSLYLCPCLNPTGFPGNTRENLAGIDLNRDYRHFKAPEVAATAWIDGLPEFDIAICLHEDWEAKGFYLYELNPEKQFAASEAMLEAVGAVCPIDQSELIDGRPAKGGLLRPIACPMPDHCGPRHFTSSKTTRPACLTPSRRHPIFRCRRALTPFAPR